MESVPKGSGRLQAVKDEISRLQEELDETVSIRKEAEAEGDPDLIAECKSAEDRLKSLVSQLTAELSRLQKPSGAEALRARLQQLKNSEARARGVLGSGELPALGKEPAEVHHRKDATPLAAPGAATAAGPGLAGPLLPTIMSPAGQQPSAAAAAKLPSTGQSDIGSPLSTVDQTGQQDLPAVSAAGSLGGPELSPRAAPALPAARHAEALPLSTVKDISASAAQPDEPTKPAALPQPVVPPSKQPAHTDGTSAPSDFGSTAEDGFSAPAFGGPNSTGGTAQESKPPLSGSTEVNGRKAWPGPDLHPTPSVANSQASKTDAASLENHPRSSEASLEGLTESVHSAPRTGKAEAVTSKSGPSSPNSRAHPNVTEDSGFGKPAFRQPESILGLGKLDPGVENGFGESAFILPGPAKPAEEARQPKGLSGEGLGMQEHGKSISLRDSFLEGRLPTPGGPARPAKLAVAPEPPSADWQAFDASSAKPSSELPGKSRDSLSWELTEHPNKAGSGASGSGGFGSSGFGSTGLPAFPSRSATHSPAPSAKSGKSGNPFQEFYDMGGFSEADNRLDAGQSNTFSSAEHLSSAKNWPSQASIGGGSADAIDAVTQPKLAPPSLAKAPLPPQGAAQKPPQAGSFPAFPDPFAPSPDAFPPSQPVRPASQPAYPGPSLQHPDAVGAYDPFSPSQPAANAQPFQDAFAAASASPGTVPILPGSYPVPQRSAQVGGLSFGGLPHAGYSVASGGASAPMPSFTDSSGTHFVVTPSMVIPEADWEAAFAGSQPTLEVKQPAKEQPPPSQQLEPADDDVGDASVWVPMTDNDRSRCEQAFHQKYGGTEGGKVGLAQARELYNRADISIPLESIFALCDFDRNGRLSYAEFLMFMYMLKILRKGAKLPKRLTNERVSYLLGTDLSSLGSAGPQAAAAPPAQASVEEDAEASSPMSSNVSLLMSKGFSRDAAKRALFLNGDNLGAAEGWLATRKSQGRSPSSDALGGKLQAMGLSNGSQSTAAAGRGQGLETVDDTARDSGPDGERVVLRIEKALLQYKKTVDRPLFSVSLRDAWGEAVEPLIDTPPCQYDKGAGVFKAGHNIYLKTPVNKMPEGAVVYFELKHWKSKEKRWSTLGWTFVHKETFIKLVDGQPRARTESQGLHLYEKPLDARSHFRQGSMRKLRALSEAPDLFLRVSVAPS